ncbi:MULTISPECIES: CcoQ/FixQ family Cbb3-type cytochrome c oxidase assembly chaperone [Pseudoalteromonas]|uniref:CcoQ/FixQ family Cbb3-type cytochrome c oxidase assembly chaperone n=1 Tax=Pseudoalteromonas ruthenica TaxID=151081 RepID=A0A0F4Q212_9GAMM|nr:MULTISPECIES: CcoQ/FixQ family Cbb3-type cytochrome c oxidase assembly chaperone [Pseudoalteromonas]KJY98942.1 cytochrome oxidase [Pseudoalteromonas ruthenica]KJZ01400.1 cytochrome oxidase [Pseudoalteromonas ruthenica]MCF2861815.1 CcoQ/FixQ family Cbb3-type cytochrome c oxidase assembly chaperone [Pseudoalteromonas sp. CNAT2-18]MCG7544410.1 CcoQ/FixQ family Cbb3-type cytochrome c oxidase assembly chaperone [Pseudoalteromonas sp. MM17-2]MCG7557146.1 CcoQ/FixQ family Cbb3-type cytochrome c ox|tara:strand:+ start:1177 stop:1362 length:186 start_codon:yes stop_codon:yes gene_type:complete
MDYGTFRGILTLVIMVLFIVIVLWAFSKRSKKRFDDAANSVFEDEKKHQNTITHEEKESEK